MKRILSTSTALVIACVSATTVQAHELWFEPSGVHAAAVRLMFGESPNLNDAEQVAEIAYATVWAAGKPLAVTRLPDGLEVPLPDPRPAVLSAFADRGVVNDRGQSLVVYQAAYAQTRAIAPEEAVNLGLNGDQVRLLLFSREDGPPIVRALWKGKPAVNAAAKIFHGLGNPTEVHTDAQGEIPCPDLRDGPWWLLVQVVEKAPGNRAGREYSEIRYKATLEISPEAAFGPAVAACLARVKEVHGTIGPWAVAGYRIGERALKELGLRRHSHDLEVVHHCPMQTQYSCMADGLSAATGVSSGKLNLRLEESNVDGLKTLVKDRAHNRVLIFTLKPQFVRSIIDLPADRLEVGGRRVAALPDDAIFSVSEMK